jgi:hypothetical protein
MPLTDRVFRAFESELVKHLTFTFTIVKRVDSSGTAKNRFKVWMRNNSTVVLKNVRGSIGPGPAAEFKYTSFFISNLGPRKECEIAQIDAAILEPMHNRFAFDRMATVNVSGEADLSTFRFKDTGRALTYVAARIPVADEDSTPERKQQTDRAPDNLELDWRRVYGGKKPA